jgi:hypothetical protein
MSLLLSPAHPRFGRRGRDNLEPVDMKRRSLGFALLAAISYGAACAEPAKAAEEPSGCVERATAEKFILENNMAELLRGESSDGKTQAIWTNGTRIVVVNYVRPADGKMDELKTICISNTVSNVNFNLEVIEKLVQSAAESLKKK